VGLLTFNFPERASKERDDEGRREGQVTTFQLAGENVMLAMEILVERSVIRKV
jgi:hypothetical protein